MTTDQFVYWLQGYFELVDGEQQSLSVRQVEIIKRHLDLVLVNVTTSDEKKKKGSGFDLAKFMEERLHPDLTSPGNLLCGTGREFKLC